MVTQSNSSNKKLISEPSSPTNILSLENSKNDLKNVKSEETLTKIIRDKTEVKKETGSLALSKTLSLSSSSTSSTATSTSLSVLTSASISTEPKNFQQYDPVLENEDGSMLTTPRNIPKVISKDQNKLIHLDPVPNFQDKAEIKPWLQKIFYPMGIEIVIERSDNTKVIFKCKASKRGRKSRKSSTNGTPNKITSTFEDTVKECAEKFIIHDDTDPKKQTSEKVKEANDSKTSTSMSQESASLSSQPPRVKKKRAVSRFNVCPFRIRATYSLKRHKWSIVVVNNIHSHELNFDPNSEEYKKFKAKLRENNDIEAIKKFDELEYRKIRNLPIHTSMIPCDCGLTNEIESFNIVIPNVNPIKPISTLVSSHTISSNTDYVKTNNIHNSSSKVVTAISNSNNTKRKTISDLIMQKSRKNNVIQKEENGASVLNIDSSTIDNMNNIDINEVPLSQLQSILSQQQLEQHRASIINRIIDWGIQEKFTSFNNFNPLSQNFISSNNSDKNNSDYKHIRENNFGLGYNNLNTFYGLSNNDSHTEIIKAKDVIHDEENDEELGNYVQRINDDYVYNGNNNVMANEYYHNDFDSYNTDYFYKFNGPFDSGNIILNNNYNHTINSLNQHENTNKHDRIYNTGNDFNNVNNTNHNNNNNNNKNTNVANKNYSNTINVNVNNSYNNYYNSHLHEVNDDLLLINNFIDDPIFNESHLNMMNLHSINLETPFHNIYNDNTIAGTKSRNNDNDNTGNNNCENINDNGNSENINLIDLNEIDFTDIFINNVHNTMSKFTPKNPNKMKNELNKEELKKPEEEAKDLDIFQQNFNI